MDVEGEKEVASLHALEKMVQGHHKVVMKHEQMVSLISISTKKGEYSDANTNLCAEYWKEWKAKKHCLEDAKAEG